MKRTRFLLLFIFLILVKRVDNYAIDTYFEVFTIQMKNLTNSAWNEYTFFMRLTPGFHEIGKIIPLYELRIGRAITCLPETITSKIWLDEKIQFDIKSVYQFYPKFTSKGYQKSMGFKIMCKNPPVTLRPILIPLQFRLWSSICQSGYTTIQTSYPSLFHNSTMRTKFDNDKNEVFLNLRIEPSSETYDLIKKLQIHGLGDIVSMEYLSSTGIIFAKELDSQKLKKVKEGLWMMNNIVAVNKTITINLKAKLNPPGGEYSFGIISQTLNDFEVMEETQWGSFNLDVEEKMSLKLKLWLGTLSLLIISLLFLVFYYRREIKNWVRGLLRRILHQLDENRNDINPNHNMPESEDNVIP
jgi:hypothetical protein